MMPRTPEITASRDYRPPTSCVSFQSPRTDGRQPARSAREYHNHVWANDWEENSPKAPPLTDRSVIPVDGSCWSPRRLDRYGPLVESVAHVAHAPDTTTLAAGSRTQQPSAKGMIDSKVLFAQFWKKKPWVNYETKGHHLLGQTPENINHHGAVENYFRKGCGIAVKASEPCNKQPGRPAGMSSNFTPKPKHAHQVSGVLGRIINGDSGAVHGPPKAVKKALDEGSAGFKKDIPPECAGILDDLRSPRVRGMMTPRDGRAEFGATSGTRPMERGRRKAVDKFKSVIDVTAFGHKMRPRDETDLKATGGCDGAGIASHRANLQDFRRSGIMTDRNDFEAVPGQPMASFGRAAPDYPEIHTLQGAAALHIM